MTWKASSIMEERSKFVSNVLEGTYSMTDLCNYYDISRPTGYRWLGRFKEQGYLGLLNRSSAPINPAHGLSPDVKLLLLDIKKKFPTWGARKVGAYFKKHYSNMYSSPSSSAVGRLLFKEGLTNKPRPRKKRCTPTEYPLTAGYDNNIVWCIDFKGHFKTGNGKRCNPLTMTDLHSRYLLCCEHQDRMTYKLTKKSIESVFSEYGLPYVIRSDNGLPFASRGICGLSRLSCWWIRLGIHPERIALGCPQQNGSHERMHKTLKAYSAAPPSKNLRAQQRSFNQFKHEFNNDRPHEALDMDTPSERYSRSPREYRTNLEDIHYPDHMKIVRIHNHGDFNYKGRRIYLTEGLKGEYIGIDQVDDNSSLLWYCNYLLGSMDHKEWKIVPVKGQPPNIPQNRVNDGT